MSVRGKITLFKRWFGILTGNNRMAIAQGPGQYYSKDAIEGYYNDLTGKINEKTLVDENGITYNLIEGNQKVYFPISIFQYCLGLWDLQYSSDKIEIIRNNFLNLCKWIVDNQRENGSWNCFGPIGYRDLTVSSMGQGEAISVLVRAYVLTGEEKWKEAAQKAMDFMMITIENGGVLRVEGDEYYLEEYANNEGIKKSVLNGWIFSLFGIYDYLKLNNDPHVRTIYKNSINTLKQCIEQYDTGFWSYYDLSGHFASPAYHQLHIALLTVLYDITGEKVFIEVASKWKDYKKNVVYTGFAIIKKAIQKLNESPEGIIIQ